MREIKFRAWDKTDNKMFYESDNEFLLFRVIGGRVYVPRVGGFFNGEKPIFCETNSVIPMQYTGLKDKNGKEIYEGDIVELVRADLHIPIELPPQEVKWRPLSGYDPFLNRGLGYHPTRWKVIGNIYENPELLEMKE